MQEVWNMEAEGGSYIRKGLHDYSYLLGECAGHRTPYIAIFEDDTLAMRGWYHRTIAAIEEAERQTNLRHGKPQLLHLRLFYTEKYLGWNKEEWVTYLLYISGGACISTGIVLCLWRARRRARVLPTIGVPSMLLTTYSIFVVFVILFFTLGRGTVLPLPQGVHEMANYGCCGQALVFPRQKALDLIAYFKGRSGFMDLLTEQFANERGDLRFAVTPSLVQHIGKVSSKAQGDKHAIWSFGFERWNPGRLGESGNHQH